MIHRFYFTHLFANDWNLRESNEECIFVWLGMDR